MAAWGAAAAAAAPAACISASLAHAIVATGLVVRRDGVELPPRAGPDFVSDEQRIEQGMRSGPKYRESVGHSGVPSSCRDAWPHPPWMRVPGMHLAMSALPWRFKGVELSGVARSSRKGATAAAGTVAPRNVRA